MKKRNIAKMFLLEIITLGIYRLFWLIKTRKELMARTGVKIPSILFLFAPLILIIILVSIIFGSVLSSYSSVTDWDDCMRRKGYDSSSSNYVSTYSQQGRIAAEEACDAENEVSPVGQIMLNIGIFFVAFLYLPLLAWWFWGYSQAVEKATDEKLSRALCMILFLAVPDGLDILIVQDYFNKVPEAQGVHAS